MANEPNSPLRITVRPRSDDFAQVAENGPWQQFKSPDPVGQPWAQYATDAPAPWARFQQPPQAPAQAEGPAVSPPAPLPGTPTGTEGSSTVPASEVAQAPVAANPDMAGFTRALDSMEGAPQRPSFFDKFLEPFTSYPATEAHMATEARDQMGKGVKQIMGEPPGERLYGAGNLAIGALSYPLAPISAALRTVVGKPLEENTGIPKEYSEFAAGLALPVVGFGKAPKTLQKIFSPETVSPEAMEAAALIRQRTGIAARDTESTAATLESWQKPVNQLPPADQLGIMHYVEGTGPAPASPQMRALADTLKDAFDLRKQKLQALPEYAQRAFLEDYFPHFWQDPLLAQSVVRNGGFSKQGSGASLKGRTIPTIQEGLNQGLTPLTTNPIEATMRYVTSMDKFIASREMINAAEQSGTILYRHPSAVGASGHPNSVRGIPPGYTKLEGRASAGPGGDAFAPDDWARVYNNFISRGFDQFGGGEYGDVYNMLRRGANAITQTLLSFSGYHAFTMAEAGMSSQMAKVLSDIRHGQGFEAVKDLGKYVAAPFSYAAKGRDLRDVYLGKVAAQSPQDKEIVDLITQAGGRMSKHSMLDYESSALGDYITAFRRGRLRMELAEQGKDIAQHPISGTARTVASNIGRVMDTFNKPLFQHYIPAMKNAAAHENMAQWLGQNPAATQAEKLAAARKIVDSVDNRFGEMIHDNIFWNKVAKQSAMLGMLSYSWNMGGVREIGGGVRDMARTAVGRGEWTPKSDYVVGMALNWAIMSAAYQFMKTGEAPRDVHDLAAPRTGGIDARSGEPERIIPPGIMKDVFGYWDHFGQEVVNKLNPALKLAGQSASITTGQGGSDWRGDPILSPRSPGETSLSKTPEWLAEYFNFIIKAATPIQVQNITRGNEEGSNINSFEKALGIRKAPRALVDPEGYEHMLNNLWSRKQRNKLRHENVEKQRYGGTE